MPEIALGRMLVDEELAAALSHIDMSPEEIASFEVAHLSDVPLVQQCGTPSVWLKAIIDWHLRTWFVVSDESETKVVVRTGTRPGDPLADAIF